MNNGDINRLAQPPRRTGARPAWRSLASRAALVLCAGAALSACTLGPDYKRPELPLATSWRAEIRDGAELANTDWWRGFGDADLDRLIDAAIDNNKDLMLATLRIEEFDSRLQVSRAAKYPQVGYSTGTSREKRSEERPNGLQPGVSPYVDNYEIGANASWELDLWGRVKRANEAALADLLTTQEARRGVMLSVVSSVAASYVQLLDLDLQLAVARQVLKNREDAIALAEVKYQGGSGTRLSVEQARADLETEASNIPVIERDVAALENALSALVGLHAGPVKRRQLSGLKLLQMPQGVPADVLTRRPDVMAAEQSLVAANARIGVAKTQYFPTLSLTAAFGLGSDDPRWLWSQPARAGSLAAALAGPLFTGGRIEGDIRQAEAVQKQSVVAYQQAVQTALREVEDALSFRTKAGEREASLGRRVALLEEVARLSRLRYEGGQSTQKEVLDADLRVYAARGVHAQSRRDTMLSLVAVYKSMGGGWMVEQDKRRNPPTAEAELQASAQSDAKVVR